MHRTVLIVSVLTANVPHVPHAKAFFRDDLGYEDDGIDHITVKFGFSDDQDLPRALHAACLAEVLDIDPDEMQHASYFISRGALRPQPGNRGMARWRKKLFVGLAHNAADPAARFGLPAQRTVTMGSDVEI